jgi:L-aspartate oxidase
MRGKHPLGSLAPRDIVARAIDDEMKHSGSSYVYLDVTHKPSGQIKKRFPTIYKQCLKAGIDITRELVPVVPSAHYMCGGVSVDTEGRTSIINLFACGETACTGVHGANRLASNSLLEAVVFSNRALQASMLMITGKLPLKRVPPWDDSGTLDTAEWVVLSHDRKEIKQLMWDYVGIVRSTHRLRWALRRTELIKSEVEEFYRRTRVRTELVELRNLATVANLIIKSSLKRKESRGLHYTIDYPATDDLRWKRPTLMRRRP